MKTTIAALGLIGSTLAPVCFAVEGSVPSGVPHLDHVFLIMMENHGYSQIIGNPNAPFITKFANSANLATNYFAVAHPSLTNYLEVVGGSNFGVHSDNDPDWHNAACTPDLAAGTVNTDNPASGKICPIAGHGTEAATPALDTTNEVDPTAVPPQAEINIDGVHAFPAATNVSGKTIADQLVDAHRSWKSYQESLPLSGADGVNYSDGFYTQATDFTTITPTLNPALGQGDVVKLYAAKHNPFVYFKAVQEGQDARLSLANSVAFEGPRGLYADLASGNVPTFSFIAPNECNDQHGRGNAGAFCNYDPLSDGSQAGLNPALIQRGDVTVQRLVGAIKASPAWREGNNAIVLLWDENDYSLQGSNAKNPDANTNRVILAVDTNYGRHGVKSNKFYTHFSLLKALESGFALPCLNHACDKDVAVAADLFGNHE